MSEEMMTSPVSLSPYSEAKGETRNSEKEIPELTAPNTNLLEGAKIENAVTMNGGSHEKR